MVVGINAQTSLSFEAEKVIEVIPIDVCGICRCKECVRNLSSIRVRDIIIVKRDYQ